MRRPELWTIECWIRRFVLKSKRGHGCRPVGHSNPRPTLGTATILAADTTIAVQQAVWLCVAGRPANTTSGKWPCVAVSTSFTLATLIDNFTFRAIFRSVLKIPRIPRCICATNLHCKVAFVDDPRKSFHTELPGSQKPNGNLAFLHHTLKKHRCNSRKDIEYGSRHELYNLSVFKEVDYCRLDRKERNISLPLWLILWWRWWLWKWVLTSDVME